MRIFQELTAKSWMSDQGTLDNLYAGSASVSVQKKLALGVFLGVVTVLFVLLVVAYGGRMAYDDWRPVPQLRLLWANSLILILSSVALQSARYFVRRGQTDAMRVALLAGGAFTVVFLFGQLLAWRQLGAMQQFDIRNPAIGFFYLITALHGLHLLGGLIAWGRTVLKVWGDFDPAMVRQSVELCAVYWHYLLLIWLVLVSLLFTGNNFELFLQICGIR